MLDYEHFYLTEANPTCLRRIKGKPEVVINCPFHKPDKHPSFSFNTETGVWYDFHDGTGGNAVRFYMRLHSLSKEDALAEIKRKYLTITDKKVIEAIYDYKDENGNLAYQIVRYKPKTFVARKIEQGRFVYGLKGVELIPYRLNEFIDKEEVCIVEGEKDADNLVELGFVATTAPFGALKWKENYNKYFKNKKVYIFHDNDKVGIQHAKQVALNLHKVASLVKIITLDYSMPHEDISDWIDRNLLSLSKEEVAKKLRDIINATEPNKFELEVFVNKLKRGWEVEFRDVTHSIKLRANKLRASDDGIKCELEVCLENGSSSFKHRTNYNLLSNSAFTSVTKTLSSFNEEIQWSNHMRTFNNIVIENVRSGRIELCSVDDVKPVTYLYYPFVMENVPNMVYGFGGTGKTTFATWLCSELAKKGLTALYLDWENNKRKVISTFVKIAGEGFYLPYMSCKNHISQEIDTIISAIEEYERSNGKIDLAIIDSAGLACGGKELNSASTATDFYNHISLLGITTLIIHHTSKDKEDVENKSSYGTIYFENPARNIFELTQESLDGCMVLSLQHKKSNETSLIQDPIFLKVSFLPDKLEVDVVSGQQYETLFWQKIPAPQRVYKTLKREGKPLTAQEISKKTNIQPIKLKQVLDSLLVKNKVAKTLDGERWFAV